VPHALRRKPIYHEHGILNGMVETANTDAPPAAPASNDAGRFSRTQRFWALHLGGWAGYAVLSYLTAMAHGKPYFYYQVAIPTAMGGAVLTWGLRYIIRAAWSLPPAPLAMVIIWPIIGVSALMGVVYVWALSWGYCWDCRPEGVMGYLAYIGSFIWVVMAWVALYFAIKKHEESKYEAERALRAIAGAHEAQLKMLRYQLNPHFLFNTLNAISTLILDREGTTANRMVTRLSAFLRHSLDSDPMQRVTLRQELDALALYLEIEQLRFEDRLVVEFEIAEDVELALLPSLLLQPLIENAIKYAVAPRVEGGHIKILARRQSSVLEVTLADDGPGCHDVSGRGANNGHGVGLANTRERLRVLYGDRQSVQVLNPESGGCTIVLRLPYEASKPPLKVR